MCRTSTSGASCAGKRSTWPAVNPGARATIPSSSPRRAEIVGLYLHPPEDAIVLAVDEKPHIQALERAQGYLKLPNGRALIGHGHTYKRHGTTTLFAALNVASGEVQAGHYERRRRREFLDFMNRLVAAYPDREIHVVLDNLNTHKPKRDRWLKAHPPCPLPLHAQLRQLAQPDRDLVLDPQPRRPARRQLHFAPTTQGRHRCLHPRPQQDRQAFPLGQHQHPSEEAQTTSSRFVIPGTSAE